MQLWLACVPPFLENSQRNARVSPRSLLSVAYDGAAVSVLSFCVVVGCGPWSRVYWYHEITDSAQLDVFWTNYIDSWLLAFLSSSDYIVARQTLRDE
jgi:hypothetical protein